MIHRVKGFCVINEAERKKRKVVQPCPTLCDPVDCTPPGSSVHGILQARILEWIAISFSRDLPNPGIKPWSPALQADALSSEPPGKPPEAEVDVFLEFSCFFDNPQMLAIWSLVPLPFLNAACTSGSTNKTLCAQDPGERSSDPIRDQARLARECPGVSGRGVGQQWPDSGLGALTTTVLGAT